MENNTSKKKYTKHKTEKKIGISYFVNTKINMSTANADDENYDEKKHPLYIQVRVRRQNTSFKSRINIFLRKDELDLFLEKADFFIQFEKELIEKTLKHYNPDTDKNFEIWRWSTYYRNNAFPIGTSIQYLISKSLQDIIFEKFGLTGEAFYEVFMDNVTYGALSKSHLELLNLFKIEEAVALRKHLDCVFELEKFLKKLQNLIGFKYDFNLFDIQYGFIDKILDRYSLNMDDNLHKAVLILKDFTKNADRREKYLDINC